MSGSPHAPQEGFKRQEIRFVEWSQALSADFFDVRYIINRLQQVNNDSLRVLDVGGGTGTTAGFIADAFPRAHAEVVDPSVLAGKHFIQHERVRLLPQDFFTMNPEQPYDAVIFRTVLHHMIGANERETRQMQLEAILKAHALLKPGGILFVSEIFYDPIFLPDVTGWIIFKLTKLKTLASLIRWLGANTAGEGVRFRSRSSWMRLLNLSPFECFGVMEKVQWEMRWWMRIPLLCRDNYQGVLAVRKRG